MDVLILSLLAVCSMRADECAACMYACTKAHLLQQRMSNTINSRIARHAVCHQNCMQKTQPSPQSCLTESETRNMASAGSSAVNAFALPPPRTDPGTMPVAEQVFEKYDVFLSHAGVLYCFHLRVCFL